MTPLIPVADPGGGGWAGGGREVREPIIFRNSLPKIHWWMSINVKSKVF